MVLYTALYAVLLFYHYLLAVEECETGDIRLVGGVTITLLGDLKCVVMEYGVECVTDSNIGVQKMPELHVVNWDSQNMVNSCTT